MLIFVAAFEILTNIDVCRIEYFFMPLQLICEIPSRDQIFSGQALNSMIILWINWTIQKSWNHFFSKNKYYLNLFGAFIWDKLTVR